MAYSNGSNGLDGHSGSVDASSIMTEKARPLKHADFSQLAKSVVDVATCEDDESHTEQPPAESAALKRGRLGGAKGGESRAEKLTAEEQSKIAKKAAEVRWSRK